MKYSSVVEDYLQEVIKKSWTWDKLTEEERQRFMNMNVFYKIKGNDKTRIEWLNTIYHSFLSALGYKPIGWREDKEKNYCKYFDDFECDNHKCKDCPIEIMK